MKKEGGFTLVEVLIVIMIVGMMSTLAINGYAQYRRMSLANLAAEDFISQANELKEAATKGKFGGDRLAQILAFDETGEITAFEENASCFGFYFEQREENFWPRKFVQKYDSKKGWNVISAQWDELGCGKFVPNLSVDEAFVLDEEVRFLNWEEGGSLSNLMIRYVPPVGQVEVSVNGGVTFFGVEDVGTQSLPLKNNFNLILRYGVSEEALYKRILNFSLLSGKFELSTSK